MKARHERMFFIAIGLVALGVIAAFVLYALRENLNVFYSPTDVFEGKAPEGRIFRVGGLVEEGSLLRQPDGVSLRFILTDGQHKTPVRYAKPLPDLFREGRGAVAQGKLDENGEFVANEVLAKHDENYMPPEVAKALEKAHQDATGAPRAKPADPAQQ